MGYTCSTTLLNPGSIAVIGCSSSDASRPSQASSKELRAERFCQGAPCPKLAPVCNLRPKAAEARKSKDPVVVLLEEDSAVERVPEDVPLQGALLELLARHGVMDPEEVITGIPGARQVRLTPLREDKRFVAQGEGRTLIRRLEPGQKGPQCPQGYYMWRMDVDQRTSSAKAACNKCAGCDACIGPKPDDCLACPLDKHLHIDISGLGLSFDIAASMRGRSRRRDVLVGCCCCLN